jgi:hypothetical protein
MSHIIIKLFSHLIIAYKRVDRKTSCEINSRIEWKSIVQIVHGPVPQAGRSSIYPTTVCLLSPRQAAVAAREA